jgi:hypothetical protein
VLFRSFIINVATSDEQAHDTIYAQEKGKVDSSPFFQYLKPNERYNEFRFVDKNVIIRCGGSNSGSLVGRNVKAALFDELARFKDTKGERSGFAVYNGLGRGTKKVPALKAKRVAISSVLYTNDIIDTLYEMTKRVPTMLGYKYATWEMNPNLSLEVLQDEFQKDESSAWRDYGVQPSRDIEKYYGDPTIIKFTSRVNPLRKDGSLEDWFIGDPQKMYLMTGDPAITFDSFGLALGHQENDITVVDFLHKITPKVEIDPSEVIYYIDMLRSRFGIQKFIVDQWNYPETLARIRNESGISVEFNIVSKVQHDKLKEAWSLGKIDCFEHAHLQEELLNLELHRGRKVEHPRRGSKDLADALAQLIWAFQKPIEKANPFAVPYFRKIVVNEPLIAFR